VIVGIFVTKRVQVEAFSVACRHPALAGTFEVGDTFYVDFIKALK
jgi:hypothetical protein